MKDIAVSVGWKIVARLPGLIVRRFLAPERLASRVRVDLRSNGPGEFFLGGAIPTLRLWFTVKNWSAFPVVLDRMSFEICADQLVCTGVIVDRIAVPGPGETEHRPHFLTCLSSAQMAQLRRQPPTNGTVRLTVHGCAYFWSKLGWFSKDLNIERLEFPCRG